MYAVIESGGKQYRVELGSEIQVDRLDVQPGDSITLDRVLLVADADSTAIGMPVVDGATVSAQVLRQDRGDKIVVFKYKPKARTRVKKGFRAELTTLRISDIALAGKSAAKDAESSHSSKTRKAEAAEKAAVEKAAADKELAAKLAAAAEEASASDGPARAAKPKPKAAPRKRSAAKASGAKAVAKAAPEEEAAAEAEPVPEANPVAEAESTDDSRSADDTKKDE